MEEKTLSFRLDKLFPHISRNVKYTVVVTFIFGFILHISSITNLLVNWDVVSHLIVPDYKFLITQGKPAFGLMRNILGTISIGSHNSIFALLFISLAAGLVVSILEYKSILTSCLAGLVMVSFPTVMCTFGYDSEDVFFCAMLLSVVPVYLVKNKRFGWIWGTLILSFSILTYPGYIGMTTGLFLFICIIDIISGHKSMKTIVWQGFKYIMVLLISCGLYYAVTQFIVNAMGLTLSAYRGIDKMGSIDFSNIAFLLQDTYLKLLTFFARDAYGSTVYSFAYLYCFVLVCFLGYMVYFSFYKKNYRHFTRPLLMWALILLIPLSLHLVALLGQNAKTHWLMIYPFCLVFVFLLKLMDLSTENIDVDKQADEPHTILRLGKGILAKAKRFYLLQGLIWLLVTVQIVGWFNLTTMGYTRMRIGYETDYSVCVQICSAISANPDFQPGTKVAIFQPYHISTKDPLAHLSVYTGISNGEIFYESGFWLFPYMLRAYLSTEYNYASQQERETILNSEEFKAMPYYPYNGYIKVIDGIIVVKMSKDSGSV